jgi:hypothetical protein
MFKGVVYVSMYMLCAFVTLFVFSDPKRKSLNRKRHGNGDGGGTLPTDPTPTQIHRD